MCEMLYFMPFIPFFMPLFVVLLCLLCWYAGKRCVSTKIIQPSHEETALDILKKRYAKGEITKEQFKEMKNDIL